MWRGLKKFVLFFLSFLEYRITVSLEIGGDVFEVLFFRRLLPLVDNTAFPGSFWCCMNDFILICRFHYALLSFDKNSITGRWGNMRFFHCYIAYFLSERGFE